MKFKGHYDVVGKGTPILCFAGFGCSNYLFQFLAEDLGHHFTFIMPDNRGMGKSPRVEGAYEIEDLARDGMNLMDDLGYEEFHVLGISMGGFISLALNGLCSDRIQKMVLCCTLGPGAGFVKMPEITKEQLEALYGLPIEQRALLSVQNTTHPSLQSENPELFQQIVTLRQANPSECDQAMYQYDAVQRFLDKPYDYQTVKAPVLALCGEADRTVPPENSRILASKVPRGTYKWFQQSDHMFFFEKRGEVAAEIQTFLSTVAGEE